MLYLFKISTNKQQQEKVCAFKSGVSFCVIKLAFQSKNKNISQVAGKVLYKVILRSCKQAEIINLDRKTTSINLHL